MPKKKSIGGRKSVKIKKVLPKKDKPIYNSDDDIPDEESESFHKDAIDKFHEEQSLSDSGHDDELHTQASIAPKQAVYDFTDSEDEEVMEKRLRKIEANIRRSQKDMSSDDEADEVSDADEEDVRVKAWGKKKEDFYGSDIRSKVDIGVSDDEETGAKLEEKEARLLQQKLQSQIDEADFGLDMFTVTTEAAADIDDKTTPVTESITVRTDIGSMTEEEKLRLLKKQYPEFLNIVADYKTQYVEYKERLEPILKLYDTNRLPDSKGLQLLRLKALIALDYCTCAQFYLLLRAEKSSVEGHPVIKRMIQFKQLLKQISEAEQAFQSDIDYILNKLKIDKDISFMLAEASITGENKKSTEKHKLSRHCEQIVPQQISQKTKKKVKPALDTLSHKKSRRGTEAEEGDKRLEALLDDESSDDSVDEDVEAETVEQPAENEVEEDSITAGEREALEFYQSLRKKRRVADPDELDEAEEGGLDEDMEEGGPDADTEANKRAITQEMQKNKGLTAKRPKSLKNPRVKNKLKFQRKKKIHKSIVPTVLRETTRYVGEPTGIRAGRIRSVQLT